MEVIRSREEEKKVVVSGVIILVVLPLLFIYAYFFPIRLIIYDYTLTMPAHFSYYYTIDAPRGIRVHSEYTGSDELKFFVLDSQSFQSFNETRDFTIIYNDAIYYLMGKSQVHTFKTRKSDTFYVILYNFGNSNISASIKIVEEVPWILYFSRANPILPIGAVILFGGIFDSFRTRNFFKKCMKAKGTVLYLNWKTDHEGDNVAFPIFKFADSTGKEYTVRGGVGRYPPKFRVGQEVEVLYEPENPNKAKIKSFAEVWGRAALATVLGFIFTSVGLYLHRSFFQGIA